MFKKDNNQFYQINIIIMDILSLEMAGQLVVLWAWGRGAGRSALRHSIQDHKIENTRRHRSHDNYSRIIGLVPFGGKACMRQEPYRMSWHHGPFHQ